MECKTFLLYWCDPKTNRRDEARPVDNAITVRNLRKTFRLSAKQRKLEHTDARTKTAVDDLSFDVAPGEI